MVATVPEPLSCVETDPFGEGNWSFSCSSSHSALGTSNLSYGIAQGARISRDPLPSAETLQGPNLYQYCVDNPTRYTDPDGRVIPIVPVVILLGGAALISVAEEVIACDKLHSGQEAYIKTPLSMLGNLLSPTANAIGTLDTGGPTILVRHIWVDNCGKCHTEWAWEYEPRNIL